MRRLCARAGSRALLAALIVACSAPAPAATAALLPWCQSVPLPQPDLTSLTSDVDSQTIHQQRAEVCRSLDVDSPHGTLRLAVAATEAQRERGLMGVPYVPARQGMLFAFPDTLDQQRFFWMQNTIAPLDMVFVKSDGTISSIAANVPATAPGTTDDAVARRDGIARYVIEVQGGEAARLGLTAGMHLRLPDVTGA